VQLNELVNALAGLLRRTFGASIEVAVVLDPSLPLVRADPSQIDQVIMNLALNARDAMPEGGALTLRTARRTIRSEDNIATLAPGEYVTLTVCDSGAGMDAATLHRAFEPFFTTKPPGQGTGLGLATAYGIVTQSGGQILVRSSPQNGSEFTVLLPITHELARADEADLLHPAPGAERARSVLVVEDMDDLRRLLVRQLVAGGFRVHEAASAESALALGEPLLDGIDILVSDIVMPGRSGIELACLLLARRPGLPVLLISGDVRNHDQSTLPPQVRFLQKPFGSQVLLREIDAVLARRG
jgi:CheY-like chemotaxis protein